MDKKLRDAMKRQMAERKKSWWASNDLLVVRQDPSSYVNASEQELANMRDELTEVIESLYSVNSDSIGEPQVFFPNYSEMSLPVDIESPDPGDYWCLTYTVKNSDEEGKDKILEKFSSEIEKIIKRNSVVAEVITRLLNQSKAEFHALLNGFA